MMHAASSAQPDSAPNGASACCVVSCRLSLCRSCRPSQRGMVPAASLVKESFCSFWRHGACGFARKREFLQFLLSFGFPVLTSNT